MFCVNVQATSLLPLAAKLESYRLLTHGPPTRVTVQDFSLPAWAPMVAASQCRPSSVNPATAEAVPPA